MSEIHKCHAQGLEWRGFAAGALANLLLAPFTPIFMMGVNRRMEGAGKMLSLEEVRELMGRWVRLNVVRVFMPLAGAVLGLWNLLQ